MIKKVNARGLPAVFLHMFVGAILMLLLCVFGGHEAGAVSVPTLMNFQGRLTDSSGTVVANGTYNMQFRMYDAASAGTLLWSEERLVSDAKGVAVTNGLFSVKLGQGDVIGAGSGATPLPATLFQNNTNVYFEITLSSANATTSTASASMVWESPMTPRNQVAASAYALSAQNAETATTAATATNAAQLGGVVAANYTQLGGTNSWTGANTFGASTTFNNTATITTTSTSALNVTNGTTSALSVDTTNTLVKLGTTGSATGASVRLLTTNAEFSGTVIVGTATNGVLVSSTGITTTGTTSANYVKTVTLSPEFAGATFTGAGSGSLSSDFCSESALLNVNTSACTKSGEEHNYYSWVSTNGAAAQSYNIYVRYSVPTDYVAGTIANLKFYGWGTTTSDSAQLDVYKNSTTGVCGQTGNVVTTATTWQQNTASVTPTAGGCAALVAGDVLTFKITLSAAALNNVVRAGEISFTYQRQP